MANLLKLEWLDINQEKATSDIWVPSEADGVTLVGLLAGLSNAQILRANIVTPIALQLVINNDAVSANVETARAKAKIRMRGADAGSVADPFDYVTVSIPAPIGTLINGKTGDVTNADVDGLKSHVLSASGVTMSTVESITYSKGR